MDDFNIDHSRSPKRRRVDTSTPRYSSPDELAASSDHEPPYPRRPSSIAHRDFAEREQHRRRSYDNSSSEESPDELDHTVHTCYRDGWSRSRRQRNDPSSDNDSVEIPRMETPPRRQQVFVPYREKMVLRGHRRSVAAVRFSPDGRSIASCSADATIRIWDTATGKHMHTLEGHLAGISAIAWSPDSKTLASGSDDKSIRLWDVSTGKPYPTPFLGHHNYIYSLAFSPKGNMLVSGSYDEAVLVWNVRAARVMRSLPAHSDPVGGVDFIRDGTLIVSCAGDGLIRIWDTSTGQCLRTLIHEDTAPVTSVRFSPNGKFVLAWTLDSSIRLWNYIEGRCVKTYQGHINERFSIAGAFGVYGEDGYGADAAGGGGGGGGYAAEGGFGERACVVSGSEGGEVLFWDVQSKVCLQKLGGHEGVVLGVDFWMGGGGLVVSGGVDRTVRVWERVEEGCREGKEEEEGEEGIEERMEGMV